jgi:hypothetical protein
MSFSGIFILFWLAAPPFAALRVPAAALSVFLRSEILFFTLRLSSWFARFVYFYAIIFPLNKYKQ